MTFVAIPNGIRVVHIGRVGASNEIVHTIGATNGGLAQGASLSSIAKSHGDAWRARIVPQMWNGYQHVATLAYSLEDRAAVAGDAGYASSLAGGGSASPAPLSACIVATMKTAKRGRTYTGRVFLGPYSGNVLGGDGQTWLPAWVSQVQTAMNNYKADVDPALGSNGRLAVNSAGSTLKGIQPTSTPVTGVLVRSYIGTQRRRLT